MAMNKLVAWSKDYENLARSASGGIFYELATHMITNYNTWVVCVDDENKFNMTNQLDRLQMWQGSRYWKPTKLKEIVEIMKDSTTDNFLFIGTPCQVRYAKQQLDPRKDIFYVCLKCHGFYNTKGVERNGEHKKQGWSKSWYHLPKDYLDNSRLLLQCKKCKSKPWGDLIISDAWDCPKHQVNEYGTSRVIMNTARGTKIFRELDNVHWEIEDTVQIRPRRIALIDVHDYNNFGNQLLAVNLINHLYKMDKDIEFVFLEERASKAHEVIDKQVTAPVIYRTINLTREPMSFILKDGIGLENLRDCESIIVLGGDCFSSNSWHWKWIRYFLFFYLAQRAGKKLFFMSNTIGNFPLYIRAFGKTILQRFEHIFVRDMWSVNQLQDIGVRWNVSLIPDLVYLELPESNWITRDDEYIVFSPSTLWQKYSKTEQEYIESCARIINTVKKITQHPVVLMPHSSSVEARILTAKIGMRTVPITMEFPNTASDARKILQQSKFNICFRMHSALQSLQGNVRCMVFGYSEKYKEQIPEEMLITPNHFHIVFNLRDYFKKPIDMKITHKQILIESALSKLLDRIKN